MFDNLIEKISEEIITLSDLNDFLKMFEGTSKVADRWITCFEYFLKKGGLDAYKCVNCGKWFESECLQSCEGNCGTIVCEDCSTYFGSSNGYVWFCGHCIDDFNSPDR